MTGVEDDAYSHLIYILELTQKLESSNDMADQSDELYVAREWFEGLRDSQKVDVFIYIMGWALDKKRGE